MATSFRKEKNRKSQLEEFKLILKKVAPHREEDKFQSQPKYLGPKLKFNYYMSQEALTFYKCFSFHRAKGLPRGGCMVVLRCIEAPCSFHGAPGSSDLDRPCL